MESLEINQEAGSRSLGYLGLVPVDLPLAPMHCIVLVSRSYGVIGTVDRLPHNDQTIRDGWLLGGRQITSLHVQDQTATIGFERVRQDKAREVGTRACERVRFFGPTEAECVWDRLEGEIDPVTATRLLHFFQARPLTRLGKRFGVSFGDDVPMPWTLSSILFTTDWVELIPRERLPEVRSFMYWYADPGIYVATHPAGGERLVTITGLR